MPSKPSSSSSSSSNSPFHKKSSTSDQYGLISKIIYLIPGGESLVELFDLLLDAGDEQMNDVLRSWLGRWVFKTGRSWAPVMKVLILLLICLNAFLIRLFAVIRFESVIHEFDPYFNFRTTNHLSEHGFSEFWNWFDDQSWYPLGRVIGHTLFPGLMITTVILQKFLLDPFSIILGWVVNFNSSSFSLNASGSSSSGQSGLPTYNDNYSTTMSLFPINVRNSCVFLAPLFASFTCIATYLLTTEVTEGRSEAGLMAALFVATCPSYLSRSVAGSYDNECVSIFALVFGLYSFIRAGRSGRLIDSVFAALSYIYMVASWGGYIFLTNTISVYGFALLCLGRLNGRNYVAFSLWYILGTVLCLNIPFVNFGAIKSSEHLSSHAIFFLCQVTKAASWLMNKKDQCLDELVNQKKISNESAKLIRTIFSYKTFLTVAISGVLLVVFYLTIWSGKSRWSGRSMTLLDPTYASKYIPIIASVSEHQPAVWSNYLMDMHILVFFMPIGLFICFQQKDNQIGNSTTNINNSNSNSANLFNGINLTLNPSKTTFSYGLLFIGIFGILSTYFSGVMIRLMLVMSPACCCLSGIGASHVIATFTTSLRVNGVFQNLNITIGATNESGYSSQSGTGVDETSIGSADDTIEEVVIGVSSSKSSYSSESPLTSFKDSGNYTLVDNDSDESELYIQSSDHYEFQSPNNNQITNFEKSVTIQASGPGGRHGNGQFLKIVSLPVLFCLFYTLLSYICHCTAMSSLAYSNPSIVAKQQYIDGTTAMQDDFREAYYWLRQNTHKKATIASWWDYGYQITVMANRTVIVDNNTWNNTHIATVALALGLNEEESHKIFSSLDVDYVLVLQGAIARYGQDDINKFLWPVRIAQGVYPDRISERDFFGERGYSIDEHANPKFLNSTIYKLAYYRVAEASGGVDVVRQQKIGNPMAKPTHYDEVFTSENWIVRIYRIKDLENRPRIITESDSVKDKGSTQKVRTVKI